MDADSERAKMIAGQHYLSDDAELLAARIKARQIVQRYGATDPAAADERQALLVSLAAQLGDDVVLEPPFHCDYGWNISLGAGSYINCNCVILDCAPVTIGASAQIEPGVMLCAASEPARDRRQGPVFGPLPSVGWCSVNRAIAR
jgi:maltose O-acetyltransferase